MKKKICIFTTIAALAILVFLVLFFSRNRFSLTINGNKIDKEEFLNAASLRKYEVTSYFTGKGAGSVDAGFWEREAEGELPYEKLADEAIEELKYFYAVYGLAKEKGYVADDSYDAFLKRWELENSIRKEKIEKGEAVYGLSEYTLELYREYEMDTIQKQYCEDLENEGMNITDADREAYYEEHKEYYGQEDDRTLAYIKIPYEAEELSEQEVKTLKNCLTSIYKQMDPAHSLKALAEKEAGVSPYLEHVEIAAEELNVYSRSISDILEYSWELAAGESTPVLDENGCLYLIECIDRKENGAVNIDDVKDNINKTLREENYNQIIERRAADSFVEGDVEAVYKFMKEHVGQ